MNLRTYLMIKMAETVEERLANSSDKTRRAFAAMRGHQDVNQGTQMDQNRRGRKSVKAPTSELARAWGITDAELKPDRGLSSLTKARVNATNFLNAERGRAMLGTSMLNPGSSLGTRAGAAAMIGGGGLAGAGLGAVGGLSAADALGLDADNDAYLARLGRYGLGAGGAVLGAGVGGGLGALGAGHLLGGRISQKELARAVHRYDKNLAKLSPNATLEELQALDASALGNLPSTLRIRNAL